METQSIKHQTVEEIRSFLYDNPNSIVDKLTRQTSLMYCCELGFIDIVNYILSETTKTYINAQDKYGYTALMYAILYRNRKIADILIQNGSDLTLITNAGENAYDFYSKSGQYF